MDTFEFEYMDYIFEEIKAERKLQDEKWGVQDHTPWYWMTILMEELGEACHAICGRKFDFKEYRKELIQVAAVTVATIESLDRNPNQGDLK